MPLEDARYLQQLRSAQPPITYSWEVGDSMVAVGNPTKKLLDNIDQLSLRALLGIGAALSEWMVERYRHLHFDNSHVAFNEAVWAASVDYRYLNIKAHHISDSEGPLKGPLALCKSEVQVICEGYPEADYGIVNYVIATANLVRYVLPKEQEIFFQNWFKKTIRHLQGLSAPPILESGALDIEVVAAPPEGVSYAVFGTPLPREAYDPDFDLGSTNSVELIDAMLQQIASSPNPYLHGAESLIANGFPGTPYRFTG